MPELPEVETIKRELSRTIVGRKIVDVVIRNPKVIKQPSPKAFRSQLKGKVIRGVLRRGKVLIWELSPHKSLTIHLRMTGQLVYPGNGQKSRVSFIFADKATLDFNDSRVLGELRLLSDWRSLRFIRELGPEPSELTAARFCDLLSRKGAKIKPLLMDQRVISGIGNLYAAEALFRAKVHPQRPARTLSDKEKGLLFKEIKATLSEAIRCGGSSMDQYVRVSGKRGNYAVRHKVYNRAGKPCPACNTPIKRVVLGGRGTYFCPRCQSG
ncbi:MAG: bifunctional DNA-formamidopyrimidine glycosylase/DNA-(apurinic or apyrimidinic site) lyase [Candidatus Omnitrophota bacterium]